MLPLFLLIPALAVPAIAAAPLLPKPSTPDPADLLDRGQAAAYLRWGQSTLDRGVRAGRVPYYKLANGRVMFDRNDLRSLVASAYHPAED